MRARPHDYFNHTGCPGAEPGHQPDVRSGRIKGVCPASPDTPLGFCNTTLQHASLLSWIDRDLAQLLLYRQQIIETPFGSKKNPLSTHSC
jgi:hypothetical protein